MEFEVYTDRLGTYSSPCTLVFGPESIAITNKK